MLCAIPTIHFLRACSENENVIQNLRAWNRKSHYHHNYRIYYKIEITWSWWGTCPHPCMRLVLVGCDVVGYWGFL